MVSEELSELNNSFLFSISMAHSTEDLGCIDLEVYTTQGTLGASQVVLVVKHLLANAGDTRDTASVSGSGRSQGGGRGNPLQYS